MPWKHFAEVSRDIHNLGLSVDVIGETRSAAIGALITLYIQTANWAVDVTIVVAGLVVQRIASW